MVLSKRGDNEAERNRTSETGSNRIVGRIIKLDRGFPLVESQDGRQFRCKHATALVKGKKVRAVIGDEVLIRAPDDADNAQIAEILPRRNTLVRKDPAERVLPQVMAANFDTVIIAHPIAELNIRRLERELVLAHETGARVVVVLTKADLAEGEQGDVARETVCGIVAAGVPVLVVSECNPESVQPLRQLVPKGEIAVLIGRSGVGKSSLVNLLAGKEIMDTTPVRETDGKGRHTTVSRAMVPVKEGGLIVDMPGVRGLGLWESESGIQSAFPDVAALAEHCRFRDCKHQNEPGCAVQQAVLAGTLAQSRLDSYHHLMQETETTRQANEQAARIRSRTGHPRRRS